MSGLFFIVWLVAAVILFALGIGVGLLVTARSTGRKSLASAPSIRQLEQLQTQLASLVERAGPLVDRRHPEIIEDLVDEKLPVGGDVPHTRARSSTNSHDNSTTGESGDPSNRRGADRHAYCRSQLVASYNGREFPVASDFRELRCRDISTRGISYFSDERPRCEFAIVRIGNEFVGKLVLGKVVRTTLYDDLGDARYCVACQFIEVIDSRDIPAGLKTELNARLERQRELESAFLLKTVSSR